MTHKPLWVVCSTFTDWSNDTRWAVQGLDVLLVCCGRCLSCLLDTTFFCLIKENSVHVSPSIKREKITYNSTSRVSRTGWDTVLIIHDTEFKSVPPIFSERKEWTSPSGHTAVDFLVTSKYQISRYLTVISCRRGAHTEGGACSSRRGRCWCCHSFHRSVSWLGWWDGGRTSRSPTDTALPRGTRSVGWKQKKEYDGSSFWTMFGQ